MKYQEVYVDGRLDHYEIIDDRTPEERKVDISVGNNLAILDETLRGGFTQIPNEVLRDSQITAGSRLLYAVLLSYAWQKEKCFPGQDKLAKDLGVSDRCIRNWLHELKKAQLIDWIHIGLGKPNLYLIIGSKRGKK